MDERNIKESQYYGSPLNVCEDDSKFDPLFIQNINDVADITSQLLVVFGVPIIKMPKTKRVIVKIFKFYDVKRHRFCPKKSDDLMQTLCSKTVTNLLVSRCDMSAVEAELTCKVIKVMVKSFFLHTPDRSVRSPITEAMLLKKEKNAWQHAASKVIRDFKPYSHIFYHSYPKYEDLVRMLFDELFERFRGRASPVMASEYFPNGSIVKHIVHDPADKLSTLNKSTVEPWPRAATCIKFVGWDEMPPKQFHVLPCANSPGLCDLIACDGNCQQICKHPIGKSVGKASATQNGSLRTAKECPSKVSKIPVRVKNVDLNLPRCLKCNTHKLFCFCGMDKKTGVIAVDCSQGPYQCQWVHMNKNPKTGGPGVYCRAEYHQCPIDCLDESEYSSSDHQICDKCRQQTHRREKIEVLLPASALQDSSDEEDKLYRIMMKDLPGSSKTPGQGLSSQHRCSPWPKSKVPNLNTTKTLKDVC